MYHKIEAGGMIFIRKKPKEIAYKYIYLRDAVMNDVNVGNIGGMIILQSTYADICDTCMGSYKML